MTRSHSQLRVPTRQVLTAISFAAAAVTVISVSLIEPASADDRSDFFEAKIRPVLVEHCYSCHSEEAAKAGKLKAGLRLDSRDGMRTGGESGPAVMPGKPDEGTLLDALRYEGIQMPPRGRLPETVIRDFETWVKLGAVDPRTEPSTATLPPRRTLDVEAGRRFWAFQKPTTHLPPTVRDCDWPTRPHDVFVLAELEKAHLSPAAPADRRTLIRRMSFDLTGLPPTPEAVAAFVADERPTATVAAELADRLLASPAFGERWARVWLDVARFAEDQAHIVGDNKSLTYPNAYLYRDWVIAALNADVPYDRFLKLQLAADVLEGPDTPELPALGFMGLGPKYYNRGSLAVMADEWEDRVDVLGRGVLGLTLACARCHDHKFDPIGTEDYYALAGVFASSEMYNRPLTDKAERGKDGQAKKPEESLHILREGKPTDLNVFVRGDVKSKGPLARRRFPAVLSPAVLSPGEPTAFAQGSGRGQLALAVASRDNPLTARVIVNRIWAQYFDRGLVGTASNFGQLGDRPSHPELLDDLSVRFMQNGWSLKWLHREIVLSATYQQDSRGQAATVAADPDNRLLGRMPRRRLSVEAWRDAVLATAGTLDASTLGGRSFDPTDAKAARRTVYAAVSRLDLNRMLALFDFPDPNATAERRVRTTTPLQKLFVLNSTFMTAQARAFAERLAREVPGEPQADQPASSESGSDARSNTQRRRVERAYQLLYGRAPSEAEATLGLRFLTGGADPAGRWVAYAHALLATNELQYLD